MDSDSGSARCCADRIGDFCFQHNSFPELPPPRTIILRFKLPEGIIAKLQEHGVRVVTPREKAVAPLPYVDEVDQGESGHTPVSPESKRTGLPAGVREKDETRFGPYPIPYVTPRILLKSLERGGWFVMNPHISLDKAFFTFAFEKERSIILIQEVAHYIKRLQLTYWKHVTIRVEKISQRRARYFFTFSGLGECQGLGRELVLNGNKILVIDD